MEILYYKIVTLALLFVSSVFAGVLPVILRRLSQTRYTSFSMMIQRTLVFSQGFASGILLGGGLLHLIPSALEGISDAMDKMNAPIWMVDFPAASFIAIMAFAVIYFFEGIIPFCYGGKSGGGHSHGHGFGGGEEPEKFRKDKKLEDEGEVGENVVSETTVLLSKPGGNDDDNSSINGDEEDYTLFRTGMDGEFDDEDDDDGGYIYLPPMMPPTKEEIEQREKEEKKKAALEREHHSHVHLTPILQKGNICEKILSAVFLWFSLSIHSFFVGLALGATDSIADFYLILVAISAHKLVASYSLGIELERSIRKRWVFLAFVYGFSASTPLGILVGIFFGLVQNQIVFELVSNICIAAAAGAFIHVAFFEFLFEFTQENEIWYQFVVYMFLFVVGYIVMAILSVWV